MLTDVTFWCSIAGIVVSVLAVIIIFLTRNNILDILDKDIILFDKNFELKKNAINEALSIVDIVENEGQVATLRPEVESKAKTAYNDLLCIVTDVKIADEFYSITLDRNAQISPERIAKFKLACRKDIGLKNKHAKIIKRARQNLDGIGSNETMLRTNVATGATGGFGASTSAFANAPQPKPDKPEDRIQPTNIRPQAQPQPNPQAQPQQPTNPSRLVAQPNQVRRPVSPTAPRPMNPNKPNDENPKF